MKIGALLLLACAAACTARVSGPADTGGGVGPDDAAVASDLGARDLGGGDGAATADAGVDRDAQVDDARVDLDASPRDYGPPRDAGDLSQFSAFERSLIELPEDSWLQVNSGFASVCDDNGEWRAVSGCGGLLAFSGGLYDPTHRWMLLFGGGHNDYAGNEVYAFKLASGTWERLTEPSLGPYNQDPLNDGQPVSRHTYDGLTFLEDQGLLWTWGGSRANDGNGTGRVWTFDPITTLWTDTTPAQVPPAAYETSSVWDPVTGLIYLKTGEHFRTYDPRTGAFAEPFNFGSPPYWPRYAGGRQRVAFDRLRRQLWFVGGELYLVYDLDQAAFVTDDWVTSGGGTFSNAVAVAGHPEQAIETGGAEVIQAADPGLDYDLRADQLVAWTGAALWVLDLPSKVWSARGTSGAPVVAGGTPIYGRFRYIDALNVFILVQSPNEVWFYKNRPGP